MSNLTASVWNLATCFFFTFFSFIYLHKNKTCYDEVMTYKLYTDGSHSVELQIAGIGGVILDSQNNKIFTFSEPITHLMSSHELKAIEYGLKKALEIGIKDIICCTDNLMNVKKLEKKEIKEEDSENSILFNNIIKLSQNFESIQFEYVPSKSNKVANYLASKTLKDSLKENSRIDIVQSKTTNTYFFKCDKLFTTEQFISKENYKKQKKNISTHYVFDLGENIENYYLDIYQVNTKETITYEKIKTHLFTNNLWKEYINQIKEILDKSEDKNVALSLPKNNDVEKMIVGMKAVSKKLTPSFEKLKSSIDKMQSVYIESGGLAYDVIFPPKSKPIIEKKSFLIYAMKKLGENYTIGQDEEIENYFDLPDMKKTKVDEIQKKYFGEFIKMVICLKEKIDIKQIKEELTEKGIKFKFS